MTSSDQPSGASIPQIAAKIVRDHEWRCDGDRFPERPWCSAAADGTPLCSGCQKLADSIADALRSLASEPHQAPAGWQPTMRALLERWRCEYSQRRQKAHMDEDGWITGTGMLHELANELEEAIKSVELPPAPSLPEGQS